MEAAVCTTLNDDVSPCAADYSLDFCLLGLWHRELVEGLLEIVEKGFPFCRRYHELLMRLLHGAACVFLRPTSGPTQHLRDEIFEACRGDAMMRLGSTSKSMPSPEAILLIHGTFANKAEAARGWKAAASMPKRD
jgi:hypothetical protein